MKSLIDRAELRDKVNRLYESATPEQQAILLVVMELIEASPAKSNTSSLETVCAMRVKMNRCRVCGSATALIRDTRFDAHGDAQAVYAVQCVNERCENSTACEWYRNAERAVNTWNERNKR